MATYLIEGTVTAWPEGTDEIEVLISTEALSDFGASVNLPTGQYSVTVQADAGDKVWVEFFAGNFEPPPDGGYTAIKAFGPFIIDDIGVPI